MFIAEELTLLGVYSGERMRLVYPNGDPVSNVDVVFMCRKYHGELTPQAGEVDRLQFFAVDALPDGFGALAVRTAAQLIVGERGDFYNDVDPVHERAGELGVVGADGLFAAPAAAAEAAGGEIPEYIMIEEVA